MKKMVFGMCAFVCACTLVTTPAWAQVTYCPGIDSLQAPTSTLVGVSYTLDPSGTTATFKFNSWVSRNPANGVPGLMEYCVYPTPSTALPSTASGSIGSWTIETPPLWGLFKFTNPLADSYNVPLNGTLGTTIGTATWSTAAPTLQLLLHISDAAECTSLYQRPLTHCVVWPSNFPPSPPPPPPPRCNGNPACKSVVVDEAISTAPLTVPANSKLHLHYTFVIVNQPSNNFNMIFYPPDAKTKDINSGGGKDHFGCEQEPDPNGAPGTWNKYLGYQFTGFTMDFQKGSGNGCPQSRFDFIWPGPGPYVLHPGESITFTTDMITRVNNGGHREFTSCGPHELNSGFTVKWFQSNDKGLHSYSTPSILANVVGCK